MADSVIVGSEGCDLLDLLNTIKNTPPKNFARLADNEWANLALALKVDSALVKELQRKFGRGDINLGQAIGGVLEEWTDNARDDATLDVLASALENSKAKKYADALKKTYAPPTTAQPPPPQQKQPGSSAAANATDPDAFRNFIRKNQTGLLQRTMVYPGVLAYLNAVEVLGDDDESHLKSKADDSARTLEFYKIMQKRGNDCYDHLLVAFKEQSGVLEILKRFKEN